MALSCYRSRRVPSQRKAVHRLRCPRSTRLAFDYSEFFFVAPGAGMLFDGCQAWIGLQQPPRKVTANETQKEELIMRGRGQALLDFLSDLWAGDLVAWMFVGGIVLGLVIFFLV